MAAAQWHLDRDGVEYGPFNWDGLQALARSGRLRPTDLVRRDGAPFWLPAYEAREDGGELAAPTEKAARSAPGPSAASAPEPSCAAADTPAPAVAPEPPPVRAPVPEPRRHAGPAVLALVLAVGGLFWFGLLLGGAAVALATRALRSGGTSPSPAGRRTALAALLLGATDVGVMTATLLVRLYDTMRPAAH